MADSKTHSDSLNADLESALKQLRQAASEGQITESAVQNIETWLTDARYSEYRAAILDHIEQRQWLELDNVFWTVIPFGTGGRRGRMYPFGSNAINRRTIGESAQGLAEYVKSTKPDGPWSCGIAYDTRHRSREFAELCAGILVQNGFRVHFLDDYRSTPELSFLIRHRQCDCGIMVTASHNPPSDNAVKVYWSTGGQLVPPHDKNVISRVMEVGTFEVADFDAAVTDGKVELCKEEIDQALLQEHVKQSLCSERDVKVIYSPLHGVGEFNVRSLLTEIGFNDFEIYEPHREPDGDFPNVPGHVSNPENAEVFEAIIERARETGAELILATDPDCDRMGAAVPRTGDPNGEWVTLNGNQLAALLADHVLGQRAVNGQSTDRDYIITTLVTSALLRRIAESYQATCYDNNLVGFKWIGDLIERVGPEGFAYAAEESHGYLVGTYARDKDGAVACMLMCELAAKCKAAGKSVFDQLVELYEKHGYHSERLATVKMEGSDGMKKMKQLMQRFRENPPSSLGGIAVTAIRDYANNMRTEIGGASAAFEGPTDNLVILELESQGNYIAVRPSGTEPKVKMYQFGYMSPDAIESWDSARQQMEKRLDGFERDVRAFAQVDEA